MKIKKYQNAAGPLPSSYEVTPLWETGQPLSKEEVDKRWNEKLGDNISLIAKYNIENGTNFYTADQVQRHAAQKLDKETPMPVGTSSDYANLFALYKRNADINTEADKIAGETGTEDENYKNML